MEITTDSEVDQKLNVTEIYLNSYIKTEVDSIITNCTNFNATKIEDCACAEELEVDEKPADNSYSEHLEERLGELNCESEKKGKFGLFKCTQCPHTAQTKWTLRKHCLLAHKSLFKCNQCNYVTDKQKLFRQHWRNHDPLAIHHTCPKCTFTTKHRKSLNAHIKSHAPSPIALHCAQCSYATNYRVNLIRHVRVHRNTPSNTQLLTCDRCTFTTFSYRAFNAHSKTHEMSSIMTYVCAVCYFSAKKRKTFLKHVKVHSGVKPLKCDRCPFETKYQHSLRKHSQTHSKVNLFKCDQCGYTLCTESSLKAHVAEHNVCSVDYKCNQCSFTSKHKTNVKRHARVHSKSTVFHCNNCTYWANNKQILRRHFQFCQKRVGKERFTDSSCSSMEFQCAQCPFTTKLKVRFKRHALEHNTEKVYKGNQSGYKNTSNLSSAKHTAAGIAKHTAVGIEFKCIYCGYLTMDKGEYRNHVTSHNASKVFKL